MTRGALYHHFDDKQALFRAVLETIEGEIAARMRAGAARETDPWAQLAAACQAYLDATLERDIQRILLDAPSVLSWQTWCTIDKQYGLGVLQGLFEAAITAGLIDPQPIRVGGVAGAGGAEYGRPGHRRVEVAGRGAQAGGGYGRSSPFGVASYQGPSAGSVAVEG